MSKNHNDKGHLNGQAKTVQSKTCFVIAPLGEPASATRKRSDQVLKYIIEPAAKECGYTDITRADKLANPRIISSQVIQLLLESDLVVADLTDYNANVFYEMAIRHVVKKPIVQLIQTGFTIPFDVSQMRTIRFNLADPDELLEAKAALQNQIISVEQNPALVDNPISVAVDMKALAQSDDPVGKSNAEILTAVNEMRGQMIDIMTFVATRSSTHPLPGIGSSVFSRNLDTMRASANGLDSVAPLLRQDVVLQVKNKEKSNAPEES